MINLIAIPFILYTLILIFIGIHFYRKSKTERSFTLGNRSLNYWVTAISAQTSDMGSWLFIAYPAVVYAKGTFSAWISISFVLFMYLNWKFIAKKLRSETEKYKSLTLSSYFESKYNDTSGIIKVASAIISIIFFTIAITSELVSIGRLFESAFNIEYLIGVLIGISITITYILLGGFLTVSWINLVQGLFLLAIAIIVPIYAYPLVGGFAGIKSAALAKSIPLNLFSNLTDLMNVFLLTFGWGLGYFGQPHILINFMGINDPEETRKAMYVGIAWQTLALLSSLAIGLIGIAFFQNTVINGEHLFVNIVKSIFPPLLSGFALCAILAASLSTINTQILVAATGLSEDLYKVARKDASSVQMLKVTRISTALVSLLALVLSSTNSNTVYDLVLYSWSGLGSSFGPLVILSLYSNRVNKYGAISGILTGGIISGIWPSINTLVPPLIPGFFLGLVVILLVSKITNKKG